MKPACPAPAVRAGGSPGRGHPQPPAKRNALEPEMLVRMYDAWLEIDSNPDIRVAIVTGAGGNFCSGADLKAMAAGHPDNEYTKRFAADGDLHWKALLRHFIPIKPMIAAVEGYAIAGGTEILQAHGHPGGRRVGHLRGGGGAPGPLPAGRVHRAAVPPDPLHGGGRPPAHRTVRARRGGAAGRADRPRGARRPGRRQGPGDRRADRRQRPGGAGGAALPAATEELPERDGLALELEIGLPVFATEDALEGPAPSPRSASRCSEGSSPEGRALRGGETGVAPNRVREFECGAAAGVCGSGRGRDGASASPRSRAASLSRAPDRTTNCLLPPLGCDPSTSSSWSSQSDSESAPDYTVFWQTAKVASFPRELHDADLLAQACVDRRERDSRGRVGLRNRACAELLVRRRFIALELDLDGFDVDEATPYRLTGGVTAEAGGSFLPSSFGHTTTRVTLKTAGGIGDRRGRGRERFRLSGLPLLLSGGPGFAVERWHPRAGDRMCSRPMRREAQLSTSFLETLTHPLPRATGSRSKHPI